MNRPNVGLAIFVLDFTNNKILIGKRMKEKLFGLPGGKLEYGESFEECASRELLEETNLNIPENRFKYSCSFNCIKKEIDYHWIEIVMICQINDEEEKHLKNNEPEKCENWIWVNFEEIEKLNKDNNLFIGLNHYLEKYKIDSINKLINLRQP